LEFLHQKIGRQIEEKKVTEILDNLGFKIEHKKERLLVTVPSWRATKDISIPEDLVEEVLRIYGYGKIETGLPIFPIIPPEKNELRLLERKIKQILSLEFGFTESYNYSFVSPQLLQKLDIDTDKYIELNNPIDKTRPYLRRSLLPNLLENAEHNLHSFDEARLFEIGKVFMVEDPGEKADKNSNELLPRQNSMLGMVYACKEDKVPFYTLASALINMLERLGYSVILEKRNDIASHFHPGRQARLVISDQVVGIVGEVHPVNQKNLGLEIRTAVGTVDINKLLELFKEKNNYHPVSSYPAIRRDIAFVVDKEIEHARVIEEIKKVDSLIAEVELFDVFEGKNIEAGKKSLAYHIVYQADNRTLETKDVDAVHARVEKVLVTDFKANLRHN